MKKSLLLALAVSAAMLAVPALASAQSAHISATSEFTVTGGESTLKETNGLATKGASISGKGNFTNTTEGTLNLTFGEVREEIFNTKCGSVLQGDPESSGLVTTTNLRFHLIMLATNKPGILITPDPVTNVFAHFNCLGVEKTVTGKGILGTIITPACGVESTTARLRFLGTNGHQEHKLYTGVTYDLHTNSGGAPTASMNVPNDTATIHFPAARSIVCTHTA